MKRLFVIILGILLAVSLIAQEKKYDRQIVIELRDRTSNEITAITLDLQPILKKYNLKMELQSLDRNKSMDDEKWQNAVKSLK